MEQVFNNPKANPFQTSEVSYHQIERANSRSPFLQAAELE